MRSICIWSTLACLCGPQDETAGTDAGRPNCKSHGESKYTSVRSKQEARIVNRPIALGPTTESLAPLGYRRCRGLFLCALGNPNRLGSTALSKSITLARMLLYQGATSATFESFGNRMVTAAHNARNGPSASSCGRAPMALERAKVSTLERGEVSRR